MSGSTTEPEHDEKTKLSTKRGKASSAEKEATTRHGHDPDPAAQPTAGAFGKAGESIARGSDPTRQPPEPGAELLDADDEEDDR